MKDREEYISILEQDNAELKKKYENAVVDYETTMVEKKELKKQLEEINKMIEKCGFVNIEQVMLNYCGLLTQQKEFIKYLEDEIKIYSNTYMGEMLKELKEILQKYRSIIGVSDEKK